MEIENQRMPKARFVRNGIHHHQPAMHINYVQGTLVPSKLNIIPKEHILLQQVIFGLPQKEVKAQILTFIVSMRDDISLTKSYKWKDGCQIFDMNTRHLCLLENVPKCEVHASICKWENYTR